MNYGRYFRLNQALSKVVSGVAIYDYIDLPAYFGPSEGNPMSPKYPISMTITTDAVCFRLHYSAFKIEKRNKEDNESKEKPRYAYTKEDMDEKAFVESNMSISDLGMAHMEEVILELPYINTVFKNLSDTIKDIYNTTFPQIEDENVSMGGRFLEQIIRKRYPGYVRSDKEVKGLSLEDRLFHKMQIVSDNTASYSSLWLMNLLHGDDGNKHFDLCDKKGNVIGFLRKLLLDFMFDLKHSDVFQNSAYYQQMYSGLMSDFYFSALMHKCEYYYYRDLMTLAIKDSPLDNEEDGVRIVDLYANKLFIAEKLWQNDIMSFQADNYFEHSPTQKSDNWYKTIKRNVKAQIQEEIIVKKSSSWFTDQEEEMQRVCFITKDEETGEKYICNADTITKSLLFRPEHQAMQDSQREARRNVSQWFLRRYDFTDTFHVHFRKIPFLLLTLFILIVTICFLQFDSSYEWIRNKLSYKYLSPCQILFIALLMMMCVEYLKGWYYGKKMAALQKRKVDGNKVLVYARKSSMAENYVFVIAVFTFVLMCGWLLLKNEWSKLLICISVMTIASLFVNYLSKKNSIPQNYSFSIQEIASYVHLTLPRLVASITTAWITMSMGFDLLQSFFDKQISIPFISCIIIVLFLFIVYEIKKVNRNCPPIKLIFRSITLLIVSYLISIIAGIVIIDFVGEKFLERNGYINDFYEQYVGNPDPNWRKFKMKSSLQEIPNVYMTEHEQITAKLHELDSTKISRKMVSELKNIYHTDSLGNRTYPIAREISIAGHKIFLLKDFLFMFSVVAMFIGIFLQMVLFEKKQITEI